MRKRQVSKAPIGLQATFGHVGNHQAGHRTFGFRTSPAESGTSVNAPPPAEKELRLRICRAGPGFGPGAAKPADPGLRSMTVRRNPRLRPRIPPSSEPKLRPRDRDGGKRDVSSKPPNGEPPGLRPWSGSPRGNRLRLRPDKDPGGSGAGTPGSGAATRNRPMRDASPPRLGFSKGTVGAGGNAGPHYCSGPGASFGKVETGFPHRRCDHNGSKAPVGVRGVHILSGQSSRCRPASWQRA
jgi:hypothetical protein